MNMANDITKTALNYALSVLFELDDSDVVVERIEIAGGMPRIHVDRAPPSGRPARAVTKVVDGRRVTHNAVEIRGCYVEWNSMPAPLGRPITGVGV